MAGHFFRRTPPESDHGNAHPKVPNPAAAEMRPQHDQPRMLCAGAIAETLRNMGAGRPRLSGAAAAKRGARSGNQRRGRVAVAKGWCFESEMGSALSIRSDLPEYDYGTGG